MAYPPPQQSGARRRPQADPHATDGIQWSPQAQNVTSFPTFNPFQGQNGFFYPTQPPINGQGYVNPQDLLTQTAPPFRNSQSNVSELRGYKTDSRVSGRELGHNGFSEVQGASNSEPKAANPHHEMHAHLQAPSSNQTAFFSEHQDYQNFMPRPVDTPKPADYQPAQKSAPIITFGMDSQNQIKAVRRQQSLPTRPPKKRARHHPGPINNNPAQILRETPKPKDLSHSAGQTLAPLVIDDYAVSLFEDWLTNHPSIPIPSDAHFTAFATLSGLDVETVKMWFGKKLRQARMPEFTANVSPRTMSGLSIHDHDTEPIPSTTPRFSQQTMLTQAAKWVRDERGVKCTAVEDLELLCRNEDRPFQCTLKCGQTFDKKDDWRKHEEINRPQEGWLCNVAAVIIQDKIPTCTFCGHQYPDKSHMQQNHSRKMPCHQKQLTDQGRISYRKDKFHQHFNNTHPNLDFDAYHENSYFVVESKFPRRCGFCTHRFIDWKERIKHIGDHFASRTEARDMTQWQDRDEEDETIVQSSDDDDSDDENQDNKPNGSGDTPGSGKDKEDDSMSDFFSDNSDDFSSGPAPPQDSHYGYPDTRFAGSGDAFSQSLISLTPDPRNLNPRAVDKWQMTTSEPSDRDLATLSRRHRMSGSPYNQLIRTKVLGYGPYSVVDEVQNWRTGVTLARKTIHFYSESNLASLMTEVNIMKRLNHPHIVRFVGNYAFHTSFSILMTPSADCDLGYFMDTHTGIEERCMDTMTQWFSCLVSSVHYMHSNSIKHQDIKPSNILISGGNIFLADFGVAKDFIDSESTTSTSGNMTRKYCSPETAHRGLRGRSSDIFSLGCVFTEMLSFLLCDGSKAFKRFQKTHFAGEGAFQENLDSIQQWLNRLQARPSMTRQPYLSIVLDKSRLMLLEDPRQRPSAQELARRFKPGECCSVPDLSQESDKTPSQCHESEMGFSILPRNPSPLLLTYHTPPNEQYEAPGKEQYTLRQYLDGSDRMEKLLLQFSGQLFDQESPPLEKTCPWLSNRLYTTFDSIQYEKAVEMLKWNVSKRFELRDHTLRSVSEQKRTNALSNSAERLLRLLRDALGFCKRAPDIHIPDALEPVTWNFCLPRISPKAPQSAAYAEIEFDFGSFCTTDFIPYIGTAVGATGFCDIIYNVELSTDEKLLDRVISGSPCPSTNQDDILPTSWEELAKARCIKPRQRESKNDSSTGSLSTKSDNRRGMNIAEETRKLKNISSRASTKSKATVAARFIAASITATYVALSSTVWNLWKIILVTVNSLLLITSGHNSSWMSCRKGRKLDRCPEIPVKNPSSLSTDDIDLERPSSIVMECHNYYDPFLIGYSSVVYLLVGAIIPFAIPSLWLYALRSRRTNPRSHNDDICCVPTVILSTSKWRASSLNFDYPRRSESQWIYLKAGLLLVVIGWLGLNASELTSLAARTDALRTSVVNFISVASAVSVLGARLMFLLISYLDHYLHLPATFATLIILFFGLDLAFTELTGNGMMIRTAIHAIFKAFFNLGPNTITFLVPSGCFPVKRRSATSIEAFFNVKGFSMIWPLVLVSIAAVSFGITVYGHPISSRARLRKDDIKMPRRLTNSDLVNKTIGTRMFAPLGIAFIYAGLGSITIKTTQAIKSILIQLGSVYRYRRLLGRRLYGLELIRTVVIFTQARSLFFSSSIMLAEILVYSLLMSCGVIMSTLAVECPLSAVISSEFAPYKTRSDATRLRDNLPHITIHCPVYKEGLASVIAPTILSIKKAISTYELQGGSADIFINDDGFQIIGEQERQDAIDIDADFHEFSNKQPCSINGFSRPPKAYQGLKSKSLLNHMGDTAEHVALWAPRWKEFKDNFWHKRITRTLIATSLCWFCMDVAFYGLGSKAARTDPIHSYYGKKLRVGPTDLNQSYHEKRVTDLDKLIEKRNVDSYVQLVAAIGFFTDAYEIVVLKLGFWLIGLGGECKRWKLPFFTLICYHFIDLFLTNESSPGASNLVSNLARWIMANLIGFLCMLTTMESIAEMIYSSSNPDDTLPPSIRAYNLDILTSVYACIYLASSTTSLTLRSPALIYGEGLIIQLVPIILFHQISEIDFYRLSSSLGQNISRIFTSCKALILFPETIAVVSWIPESPRYTLDFNMAVQAKCEEFASTSDGLHNPCWEVVSKQSSKLKMQDKQQNRQYMQQGLGVLENFTASWTCLSFWAFGKSSFQKYRRIALHAIGCSLLVSSLLKVLINQPRQTEAMLSNSDLEMFRNSPFGPYYHHTSAIDHPTVMSVYQIESPSFGGMVLGTCCLIVSPPSAIFVEGSCPYHEGRFQHSLTKTLSQDSFCDVTDYLIHILNAGTVP